MLGNATISLAEINKHVKAGRAMIATVGQEGTEVTLVLAAAAERDDVTHAIGLCASVRGDTKISEPTVAANGLSIVYKYI